MGEPNQSNESTMGAFTPLASTTHRRVWTNQSQQVSTKKQNKTKQKHKNTKTQNHKPQTTNKINSTTITIHIQLLV